MSFNDKIFDSLFGNDQKTQNEPPPLSTAEKRKIIFRNINKLDHQTKLDIMAIPITRGMGSIIKSCSEGVIIDLNNLDPDTINQMYYMLDYKINNI